MNLDNNKKFNKTNQQIIEDALQLGVIGIVDFEGNRAIASNWDVPHISLQHASKVALAMKLNVIHARGLCGNASFVHNGLSIVSLCYVYGNIREVIRAEEIGMAFFEAADMFYDCETEAGNIYLGLDLVA